MVKSMIKIYGTPPTRVIRAIWLLNELDLEYEITPIDLENGEHSGEAFLGINPAGKVPVLVDGDVVISESSAIQIYLAEKYPDAGFIPPRIEDRAQMYRWIFFLVTEIEAPLWRIARNTFVYPEDQRVADDVPIARQECMDMLSVFENYMTGRDYVVTDKVTVADFNAAYTLDWADEEKMLEDYPVLSEYRKMMYSRPKAPPTIVEAFSEMENQE